MDAQQREVDANYEVLQSQLAKLMESHAGQFALMKDGKIVEYFDTRDDAIKVGNRLYADRVFSANEIINKTVDLGFHSQF